MKSAQIFLGLASLCGSLAFLPSEGPSSAPQGSPPREEGTVAKWIEELGAGDHEVRGRAWESLLDRGSEVLPDLDKASREGKDPEIRWNARLLAREIRRQEAPRRAPLRPQAIPPGSPRIDRDDSLFQEFEDLRRRMGDFGDLHRQMEEFHRRLEEKFRNAPPGAVDQRGNSVRVERDADGVRVEVTETKDGERESKTYEAQSWEEFRKNYPEIVEKYGLDGGGGAFPFHFAPGAGTGSWFDASPFFSSPSPVTPFPSPLGGPRLGVYVEEPSEEDSTAAGAEEGVGLVVRQVQSGSLAEAMKILPGDLLLQIGGKPIRGTETIRRAIAAAKEGSTVTVEAFRPGEGRLTLSAAAPKNRTNRVREL